jgi:tape measure domain-containing protein
MSSILASVSVLIGAELSEFKAKMAEARRELSGLVKFSEGLKDIGQSLTQYVTVPLLALGAASVAASGKIESLRNAVNAITTQDLAKQGVSGLEAVTEAAGLTTERMKELQVVAKQPGLGFESAVQGDVRLRAVGISSEQSAKSLKAFANAIALTGGGKSELSGVTVQLAQLSAKGKVLAQDLRPIIEAAPAVSGALQTLYGTVDSETISASLKKQGQSSTDFIKVLTTQLAKLPQVLGGLKNGLENFFDSATLAAAKFGDGISKALNLPAVLGALSNGLTSLGDSFANLSPGVQKALVVLAGVVAATGPILVAVGTLGAALPAITAGFAVLGVESLAALAPILPIAAAVAAAAYVIIENWDAITAYFAPTGEGGRVFRELAASVTDSVTVIGQALAGLSGGAKNNLGDMIGAATVLKTLFRDLAVGVTAFSDVVGGTIGAVVKLFQGDFKGALEEAKRAVLGLIDPLANLFGFTKAGPKESFDAFFKLADALKAADTAALADAASNSELTGSLEALSSATGLLAKLEAELKDAKDTKPDLKSEGELATRNLLIQSLEAQIKRLNELGIGSKKAQDALKKLAEELRGNGALSNALGADYDFLKERQKILEGGLKTLVLAGVSPASKAFRQYAAQLKELNTVLGDNAPLQLKQLEGLTALAKAGENTVLGKKIKRNPLDGSALSDNKLPTELKPLVIPPIDMTPLEKFRMGLQEFNTSSEVLFDQFKLNLGSAFGAGIADAIGNGTDVFASVGAQLIKTLADFAAQKGRLYIALGIADLAVPGFQGVGLAEIAGGTALMAAAGAAGAFASSLTSGGSSTSSRTSTAGSGSGGNYGQNAPVQKIQVEVTGTLRGAGKDLVAIITANDYRRLRTS